MAVSYAAWPKSVYTNGASPQTTAAITTVASGLTIVVGVAWEGGTSPAVTDSKGNTYTLLGTAQGGYSHYGAARTAVFVAYNAVGGSGHTVTFSASGSIYATITALAMSGLQTSSTIDGSIVQTIDAASPFTANITTTNANDVLVLFAGAGGSTANETLTESTGFTKHVEEINGGSYWCASMHTREVGSAGTYTPSLTTGGNTAESMLHVVAFKVDAGSGGSPVTASLAGAGMAAATGSLGKTRSSALTGVSATAARGSLSPSVAGSAGLSGQGMSASTGAIGAGNTKALTGSAATLQTGSLTRALSRALVGQSLTTTAGTVGTSTAAGTVPTLGASTVKWNYLEQGVDPTSTDPITTQASGSSILVVQANWVTNSGPAPTDNYGNTYTRVGSRIAYDLYINYGIDVWVCENAVGGANHVVTVQQNGTPDQELTVYVIEVMRAGALTDFSVVQLASGTDLVSDPVTTNGPACVIGGWFGDSASANQNAIPRNGFVTCEYVLQIGDLIQGAIATKDFTAPTTTSVGWDETPEQGAILFAWAFEAGVAAPPALTGQGMTASAGLFGPATSRSVSGQSASTQLTSVSVSRSVAISGLEATVGSGGIGAGLVTALTGLQATVTGGVVSDLPSFLQPLAGMGMSVAGGTFASWASATSLYGHSASVTGGSVLPTSPDRWVGLTGLSVSMSAGSMVAEGDITVTAPVRTTWHRVSYTKPRYGGPHKWKGKWRSD